MYFWIVLVALAVLYLSLRRRYKYWERLGVPQVEPSLLFGNVKDVITLESTEGKVLDEIYKSRKGRSGYVGLYYLWRPALMVADLELVKRVTTSEFEHFANHPLVSNATGSDRVGHSLFAMRDSEWKENRKAFSRVFTPRRLKAWYRGVEDSCLGIVPLFEGLAATSEDFELEGVLRRYAVSVVTSTLFALETDASRTADSEFIKQGTDLQDPSLPTVLKSLLYLLAPRFSARLGLQTFPPGSWRFFNRLVRDVVGHREETRLLGDDLLSEMIRMKNGDSTSGEGIGMSVDDMTGHVCAFFSAGYDTTTLTTSYCIYELSENPEVQDRLREEVDTVFENNGNRLSFEAVQSMSYIDLVLAETLRKYPPAGIIKRECSKEYLDPATGLRVPEGTLVLIPVNSIQNDPEYFPDPEKFDPERPSTTQSQSAYLPFGKGPRICIGMKFAEMEIKLALAMLLRHYEFQSSSLMTKPIEFDPRTIFISVRPKNGLWVRAKHRKARS